MEAERLKQIEEIYHAALEIPLEKREAFFNESCGADENLRREVISLLSFEKSFDNFLDSSPESLAAEMFAERDNETSLIDKEIGHYKVKKLLGRGGMGEVYLAEDTKLDRKVAVKFLNEELSRDAGKLKRFVQEAKAASALNHPNILTVYEIGAELGKNYIVTEFIEGRTLREHLSEKEPMPLDDTLKIGVQIAEALVAAHRAKIIHRDIKPENIMIREDGYAKVLDFGLAKLLEPKEAASGSEDATRVQVNTTPGMIMGTVSYISPEQARGKQTDARTDLWSFGVLLYEMITRNLPFFGETMSDTIAAILTKEPAPLAQFISTPAAELQRIVRKALAKNPADRYQTAGDLKNDLKTLRRNSETGGAIEYLNAALTNAARLFPSATADEINRTTINQTAAISRKTRYSAVGLLILLLVGGGFFGSKYFTPSKQIESIAVLPFVNVGDDRNSEYLADGLSENLINTLSRLPQLKVIARTSSFKFRGENIDVQDAARKLGVAAILTGRVLKRGDDLQISVELINAADNTRIWGDFYNRKVSAALTVPEEIAQAISGKLQLKLSGAQERQMAEQMTNNPQAYQAYMNGVFFRRKNGAENIRKAIEYQNQAVALDANFTRAYVELSINYGNLVDIGALSPKEGVPPARAAAEKALALDDTLADVYYNLARIRKYEFDWMGAEQGFKRAVELNPNLAAAHTLYAEYLSQLGRFDEALREIKLAQELDPLRTGLVGNEGSIYYQARRFDEAIAKKKIHAASAADNPFAHLGFANAYAAKGQSAEALLSYQTSIKLEETTSALIYLDRLYALTGKRAEATAILEKLNKTEKYVSPTRLAILYAALGEQEKAFASLEKAFAERDFQLTDLKVEPAYEPLRDDPRFKDLLKRINLPE